MSIETSNVGLLTDSTEIIIENQADLRAVELRIAAQVDPWMKPAERHDFESDIDMQLPLNSFMIGERAFVVPRLRLSVIPDAYNVVTNYRDHGWEMLRSRPSKQDATGRLGEYTVGIVLTGTQDGVTYEKAAWYVPHPTNFRARRDRHRSITGILTVRRYVSRPRIALPKTD